MPSDNIPRRIEYELVPDARPRREFGTLNVRRDDKDVFEQLQLWWSLQEGRDLTQWDVFTRVMALALRNPECSPPPRVWKAS